jgi:hypothetical protein
LPSGATNLVANYGLNTKDYFTDHEDNPSAAVIEVYDGSCNSLDKSFKSYADKLNAQKLGYTLVRRNSNAFIYSMLEAAGIDADSFTERINNALGTTGFLPGWGRTLPLR